MLQRNFKQRTSAEMTEHRRKESKVTKRVRYKRGKECYEIE